MLRLVFSFCLLHLLKILWLPAGCFVSCRFLCTTCIKMIQADYWIPDLDVRGIFSVFFSVRFDVTKFECDLARMWHPYLIFKRKACETDIQYMTDNIISIYGYCWIFRLNNFNRNQCTRWNVCIVWMGASKQTSKQAILIIETRLLPRKWEVKPVKLHRIFFLFWS